MKKPTVVIQACIIWMYMAVLWLLSAWDDSLFMSSTSSVADTGVWFADCRAITLTTPLCDSSVVCLWTSCIAHGNGEHASGMWQLATPLRRCAKTVSRSAIWTTHNSPSLPKTDHIVLLPLQWHRTGTKTVASTNPIYHVLHCTHFAPRLAHNEETHVSYSVLAWYTFWHQCVGAISGYNYKAACTNIYEKTATVPVSVLPSNH